MKHNVEAFKKYYVNATKEEVIEDMFRDMCYLKKESCDRREKINDLKEKLEYALRDVKKQKQKRKRAIKYIEDTCYYSELKNYSNMTDNEVKELLEILKED